MSKFELQVELRSQTGKKVKQLRKAGYVPGVLFGRDVEPVNIQCEERKLTTTLARAGQSSLIALQIGDGEKRQVLVREVQIDTLSRRVQHVDLYQVIMTDTISTDVSIELFGEPAAGVVTIQDMNLVTIECLPDDLIDSIRVDREVLTMVGQTITVKDLQVPASVTLMAGEDDLVAHVEAQRVEVLPEEVEVEAEIEAEADVEVIGEEAVE